MVGLTVDCSLGKLERKFWFKRDELDGLKLSSFFKKTLDTLPDLLHNFVSLLLTQQGTKRQARRASRVSQ